MLGNSDMEQVAKIRELIEPAKEVKEPKKPVQEAPEPVEREEVDAGADDGDTPEPIEQDETDDLDLDDDDTAPVETESKAPALEPPSGLTAAEAEIFRSSPPELQKAILRQEQARVKEVRRLQNEQAELRKKVDSEAQALAAERQQLSQQMGQYGNALFQEFQQKFQDVTDPVALARTDPVRFTEYQAYIAKLQHADTVMRQARDAEQVEQQKALVSFRQEQNELLKEKLKFDDEKFQKWDGEISEYLGKRGFKPEQIQRASAEALEMAHKAMLYDKAVAKRKASEKTTEVPKYIRPGTQSNATAKDEQRAVFMKRLKKSGGRDMNAAAGLIKGML